jgi:hypothetical protein
MGNPMPIIAWLDVSQVARTSGLRVEAELSKQLKLKRLEFANSIMPFVLPICRLYQPRQEILDGKWEFPAPQPVK